MVYNKGDTIKFEVTATVDEMYSNGFIEITLDKLDIDYDRATSINPEDFNITKTQKTASELGIGSIIKTGVHQQYVRVSNAWVDLLEGTRYEVDCFDDTDYELVNEQEVIV